LKREEIQRAVGGIHESSASKNSSTTKKPVNSTAVAVSSPRKAPLSSQNEKKTAEEIAAKAKAAKEEQKRKEKELGFGSDSDSSDNNNNNSPDISGSSDGSDSE
jgi:ribosome assembly protein YihI (activator of Der GTPase)